MISEMPKSPITSGTRPTPSISSVSPKVKRVLPETVSVPTVPAMIPKQAIMSERVIEAPVRKLSTTMPMHMREKYSGGPNLSAKLASGGAIRVRPTIPIVPAMKEAKADMPSAAPALPWRAIW
jgi:hypothetical protein